MRDPGLFAIGVGIALIVAIAVVIVVAGAVSRRREEQLMDELMFEALLERTREDGAVPAAGRTTELRTNGSRRASADRGD